MIVLTVSLVVAYSCFGKRTRNKICKGLVSLVTFPFKLLSK